MSINAACRPWHKLSSVRGECTPQRVIVFQVAPSVHADGDGYHEHTLLCGSARVYYLSHGDIADTESLDFCRPEQLWARVDSWLCRDRTTWLYGHSLAYQLTLLDYWRQLDRPSDRLLWCVLEDPPTIIHALRGRRSLKLVDLANYIRLPLPVLLGGRTGWSEWALDPGASIYDHIAWCRKVAGRLGELICRMINTVACAMKCTWQSTAASLAWALYRRQYLKTTVWVHGHAPALALEKKALSGGQLNMWRIGLVSSPTFALDVNSLYPSIMAQGATPNKLVRYTEYATPDDLRAYVSRYYCVADVDVEIPPYGLPSHAAGVAGTSTARGRYCLCGQELADVARDGMVWACYRLACYETADLFSDYVAGLYPRKRAAQRDGDEAGAWLFKLLLNSLAGKFAQRSRRWLDVADVLSPCRWGYWWRRLVGHSEPQRMRTLAGQVQRLEEGGFKRDSCPVITAAICSAGRSRLRDLCGLVPYPGPHYCDTDSLHCGTDGLLALQAAGLCHPSDLGKLKTVCSGPDAYYWSPKNYRIGEYSVSNVVMIGAKRLDDGYWLQQAKMGIQRTLAMGLLDRVIFHEREVHLEHEQALAGGNAD